MPTRRARTRRGMARAVRIASYAVFIAGGIFYIVAPPLSSKSFFNTEALAVSWGVVFAIGGVIAVIGAATRVPHTERLGLILVSIAGAVLTINQVAVMFEEPITWTRGGGTAAYGAFSLLSLALALQMGDKIDSINFVADREGRGDGP